MKQMMVLLALAIATPHLADAHAMLLKSDPPVGSSISPAPSQITLHFSEGVEPVFTTVEVTDGSGARVDAGGLHTASGDASTLFVPLKPLTPGNYAVVWHATSVDTHKTQGHFNFTVAP